MESHGIGNRATVPGSARRPRRRPPPRPAPPTAAVVLNYRSADETIACVESLQAVDYPRLQVFVVDNRSDDGSESRLRAALRGIDVIQTGRNLGYGDGNNAGIRRAMAAGAELLWIVTPDVRVSPDALWPMVQAMHDHPALGVVGPIVRAGGRCVVGCRLVPWLGYYVRHRFCHPSRTGALPELIPTDYVDGCAMLLRRKVIEQVGLLRDDFFLYFDETEYCRRARRGGWQVGLCGRAAAATRPMETERNGRTFYMVRNSLLLARLEGRYVGRTMLRHLVRAAAHALRLKRAAAPGYLGTVWRGVREGLRRPLAPQPGRQTARRQAGSADQSSW